MIEYEQPKETRTSRQNKAIHVLFEMIANELNDTGLYIGQVIKADAPWSKDRVKELIWKPIQEVLFNKRSTTQLTPGEVDQVFEVINKTLGDKGLEITFPSIEQVKQEIKDLKTL